MSHPLMTPANYHTIVCNIVVSYLNQGNSVTHTVHLKAHIQVLTKFHEKN